MRNDLTEVKQGLKDRIEDLCALLLPDGNRRGRLWVAHNPVTGDYNQTPEFKVALTQDIGAWKDWRTGDKGDVLNLIAYIKGKDFKEVLVFARDFLGLQAMSYEERRNFAENAKRSREDQDHKAKLQAEKARKAAEKLWLSGAMLKAGSAAEHHAHNYLKKRRCALEDVPNLDLNTFRFAPSVEYWTLAKWEKQNGRLFKVQDGPRFPAILSAMRTIMGQVISCHVTFLDPAKPDKAYLGPKASPRLMKAANKGAVIRISNGPENVAPEFAERAYPLILAEGFETGASLAIAVPEARVWACGSLSGIGNAPIAYPFISEVYVAGENDWEKPTALRQLDQAMNSLEQHGKPLTLMRPHGGSDFNDLMRGE
ncbi:toprim domain-containing protein [Pseudovibrio sp. POLY-S9]|uniref:toprim domain-containing protein n=1 Tax=Pseudovibrio sp. POLY-S9 TaxID=1576596 RepID=UPI00070F71D5|nr:toprim domain-containing protein [Pseudovibrio sp. POLY-S9]